MSERSLKRGIKLCLGYESIQGMGILALFLEGAFSIEPVIP